MAYLENKQRPERGPPTIAVLTQLDLVYENSYLKSVVCMLYYKIRQLSCDLS